MVHILLQFTRSIRDGIWNLYKYCLAQMLPYIARYDHHNYLKSKSVYIAEMHALLPEIETAFTNGEFVVKAAPGEFNQVDPDHAQEWLVGEVKNVSSGRNAVLKLKMSGQGSIDRAEELLFPA